MAVGAHVARGVWHAGAAVFPSVEPCHYGPLSEILARVCKEHGLRYTTYPSFAAAVQAHVSYVGSLNDRQLHVEPAGKERLATQAKRD